MIDLMNDKKILFVIRYGSYNYNLNTANSDIDWRGFSNRVGCKEVDCFKTKNNDICINNTMYLYKALTEMIPKFIELLFGDTMIFLNEIVEEIVNELISIRNDIVIMDLPYMYQSYLKDYYFHKKMISDNKYPHRKIGYTIHSFRVLDILDRFASTNFEDYLYAIRYSDNDDTRKLIIDTKLSKIPISILEEQIGIKYKRVLELESKFENINLHTNNNLKRIIAEINNKGVMQYGNLSR